MAGGNSGAAEVAAYYDRNTLRFLRFGGAGASLAIHRQLWDEGITTPRQAAEHINVLIGDAVARIAPAAPRVLDLGCGVGGTLLALARRFPAARLHGVTISASQSALAQQLSRVHDSDGRTQFLCADFEHATLGITADVVIAVEAFAHSRSADAFFENAGRHLAPNGLLIVVDDFLAAPAADLPESAERDIAHFRQAWRVPSFDTVDAAVDAAGSAGLALVEQRDLSGLIRLDQASRRLIARAAPILWRLGLARYAFFANLIGGGALHRGLASGAFTYRWLGFVHADAVSPRAT